MMHQTTCTFAARAAVLHPLLLLVAGLVSWPPHWDCVSAVVECARSPESEPADREPHAFSYYEKLIDGSAGSKPGGTARPDGWVNFRESGVIQYLENDFLLFELKPGFHRTLIGQPFETNAQGMHDGPVSAEKPPGTVRIAVLGASMDMGWGVRQQDTYINRLEERLSGRSRAACPGSPERYEVLNFAVAAYSPLQRLEALKRKVLPFHPDLVIYSATTLDDRLMEIHLCELLREGVDLKYDFVREAVAGSGLTPVDLRRDRTGELIHRRRVKEKLAPTYWRLYDQTLGAIAAECRAAGVPLAVVIVPRVGPEDAPKNRAVPVARIKALANHHAITTFDLMNTFDGEDPATLEIAPRDHHPNAEGHRRLFETLSRALDADPVLSHLVEPCGPTTPGAPNCPGAVGG